MMKMIVAGTRSFHDYNMLEKKLDFFIGDKKDIEIVSGTAKGADKLGERYAASRGFPLKQFPANWELYGHSAGYIRNREMAKYGTHAVIFWDGRSKGTRSMIELAQQHRLNFRVVRYVKSEPKIDEKTLREGFQRELFEEASAQYTDAEIEEMFEKLKRKNLRSLGRDMSH